MNSICSDIRCLQGLIDSLSRMRRRRSATVSKFFVGSKLALTVIIVVLVQTSILLKQAEGQNVSNITTGGGIWELLLTNAGIPSMHSAVTRYGSVVLLDHTNVGAENITLPGGKCRNTTYDLVLKEDCYAHSVLYSPTTNTVRPLTILTDTWCSAGQFVSDGSLVQTGGGYEGQQKVRIFKPCSTNQVCDWVESTTQTLQFPRWYTTNQLLPDGRQILVGGKAAFTVEFLPSNNEGLVKLPFLQQTNDFEDDNWYPFVHFLPTGNLYIFANRDSIIYNYKTNTVVKQFPQIPGNPRNYPSGGSSVMLPLTYSDGYVGVQILVCGGAQLGAYVNHTSQPGCSSTCGRITVTDPNPVWAMETMPIPRCMGDMILLPDQNVLIINGAQNGSQGWGYASVPAFNPVLYQTYNNQSRFLIFEPTTTPRMYHSTANLLQDGRILLAGSNSHQYNTFRNTPFPTVLSLEAFSPPYIVDVDQRTIIQILPAQISYQQSFGITFWDPNPGAPTVTLSVVLTSAPFVTHSFAQGQRLLVLDVVNATVPPHITRKKSITVMAPPNSAVAPPAYYMLWLLKNGAPSTARWVQVLQA